MATTTTSIPSDLLPLLHCPLCPPSSFLTLPVTLFCGHTVCAKHVSSVPANLPGSSSSSPQSRPLLRLTPCPLRDCVASPSAPIPPPNIPSSSRVTFYPAIGLRPDRDAAAIATIPDSRTDTTISELAIIIHRYSQRPPDIDSGSSTDSQTDEPHQISSDGPRSARKRRRKQLPPPRRLDAPAPSAADHFEKELHTELTCGICFNLLYQPITSPCQHVSIPDPPPLSPPPPDLPFVRPSVQSVFIAPWTTTANVRSVARTCLDSHISSTIHSTR